MRVVSSKTCTKCGEEKPLDGFYRDRSKTDGRECWCKDCKRAHERSPQRKEQRARYDRTAKGRKAKRESAARMRQKYPEKHSAREAVRYAVKVGRLERPEHCSECGTFTFVEAHHHNGYLNDVLDVEWLCKECHQAADAALKEETV